MNLTISDLPVKPEPTTSKPHGRDKTSLEGPFSGHLPGVASKRAENAGSENGPEKNVQKNEKDTRTCCAATLCGRSPEGTDLSGPLSENDAPDSRSASADNNIPLLSAYMLTGNVILTSVQGQGTEDEEVRGLSAEHLSAAAVPSLSRADGRGNEGIIPADDSIERGPVKSEISVSSALNADKKIEGLFPEVMETQASPEDAALMNGRFIPKVEEAIHELPVQPSASEKGVNSGVKGETGSSAGVVVSDASESSGNFVMKKDSGSPKVLTSDSPGADVQSEQSPSASLETMTSGPGAKSFLTGIFVKAIAELETSAAETISTNPDSSRQPGENDKEPEGMFSTFQKISDQENVIVRQKTEAPDITPVVKDTPVMVKRDGNSIEVTLEPDGLGKLEVHLRIEGGVVHARIDAAETAGRELLDRNLNAILNALSDEGINIGSFSVNLRDKRQELREPERDLNVFNETTDKISLPVYQAGDGIINIFV